MAEQSAKCVQMLICVDGLCSEIDSVCPVEEATNGDENGTVDGG